MRRQWINSVPVLVLIGGLSVVGCGEKEPEAPVAPVKSEAELQQEAEAARRQEQTAELATKTTELGNAAKELTYEGTALDSAPAQLSAAFDEVEAKSAEAERLLGELKSASGDQWETMRQRLEATLGELESARQSAATATATWEQRQAAALEARRESGVPIDPETGLIAGLDGGEYEPYLVSVVEEVQAKLRHQGLYAGPVDGVFDVATLEAVGAFQEREEMHVSGVPSPMTRERMF